MPCNQQVWFSRGDAFDDRNTRHEALCAERRAEFKYANILNGWNDLNDLNVSFSS